MSYEFQPGDYIAFKRIIQPEQQCRFKTDYATGRPIAVPGIPEQILPQSGEACIVSISKGMKKVGGRKYRVARAQAGKPLGVVTVILEDATLVAKQDSLFDMAPEAEKGLFNQYGGDAKGIA